MYYFNIYKLTWLSQICLDLNFPLFFGGEGCQSWSSQICLDLNFPLFWGGSKLVKSNLPRSKFPFSLEGGSKVVKSNMPRSKFPFIWGVSKLVKSNLPRSKFPLIWGGVKVGQVKSAPRSKFPFISGGGEVKVRCYLLEVQKKNDKFQTEHLYIYFRGVGGSSQVKSA